MKGFQFQLMTSVCVVLESGGLNSPETWFPTVTVSKTRVNDFHSFFTHMHDNNGIIIIILTTQ